ncbi:DUF4145 domain-containing protein [Lentibacillus sp. Marseille-P4043]|uniref:DUF4145 domain-containing protein n=1 Tax=Lentibacillus sp. Marseille-P4043 TaxID=2040293 RepID=UPI000D0B23CF|nr:DUF4145 domain-containing protein [Lentibacillus sp. Marseille-P4043]
MTEQTYYYSFLEHYSKELAYVARELENSIFTSPRTMLTHARTFTEAIIKKVLITEKLNKEIQTALVDQLELLDDHGIIKPEVRDALHVVRMNGNKAAHDVRQFRYSEALLSWEAIYTIVKWYIEVYGPIEMKVPAYRDPQPKQEEAYDMAELQVRLGNLERLLTTSIQNLHSNEQTDDEAEIAATSLEADQLDTTQNETGKRAPGLTTIREITYQGDAVEIPYFLRDAFLLPQRFAKSERFLVRLGAEEQARIMSELPADLEGIHKHVKRYNESNDKALFEELQVYIEEEKSRRKLILERPGELFFFYKKDYIVVTEELSQIWLTKEKFTGIPSLLRQLNEDGIHQVGQLPQELVILAKYKNVGIGTVENLFEQLKEK